MSIDIGRGLFGLALVLVIYMSFVGTSAMFLIAHKIKDLPWYVKAGIVALTFLGSHLMAKSIIGLIAL